MKNSRIAIFVLSALMISPAAWANSAACENKAEAVVAKLARGELGSLSERDLLVAKSAALLACESTFTDLETSLKNQNSNETKLEDDPIGWLKEQWNKEPKQSPGLDRLKRRGQY